MIHGFKVEGWDGYKVGDQVKTHRLYGSGVYFFNQNNSSIHTQNGFEDPPDPGVQLYHIMTVNLSAGTIDHWSTEWRRSRISKINVPVYIVDYP